MGSVVDKKGIRDGHRFFATMYRAASPFASRPATPAANRAGATAYHQVGTDTALEGASAHKLVVMLFDGLADALNEARGAMQRGDIALKCTALSRAARIVDEGLKAGLNLQAGGEVAQNLHTLYDYMSMTITKANLRNDEALVQEVQRLMQPVQDAWTRIAEQGPARA